MRKVYLIGNAHIDPVWLWRKTEGMSEVMATFRSALDRLNEFPGFIFTSACAYYYKWVEEVDAKMFGEIKARVAEGRWAIAGGFWIQPDCNIPGGEAFARHALYSQRYFMEKFGILARTGYNVDSFGHNGMLPQLLKKSGMDSYVFSRPDKNEKPDLPCDLFIWRSPDGSEVTAARLRNHYCSPDDVKSATDMLAWSERTGLPGFCFYGIGNHGGGPSIKMLRLLGETFGGDEDVVYSSVDKLFDDIKGTAAEQSLPVVRGDLQHHASGCYSANSAVKEANRRAENELAAAEKLSVTAHFLTGAGHATDKLREAWQALLFNQFHDVLAGCSIKGAYIDALNEIGAAREAAAAIARVSAQRISWRIRTTHTPDGMPAQKNGWLLWEKEGEGAPAVIFNPHSFAVRTAVQVNAKLSGAADSRGNPIAVQNVRGPQTNGDDLLNAMFITEIPALGYTTCYLYKDAPLAVSEPTPFLSGGCGFLENEYLKVTFDMKTGCVESLYDKAAGRELASGLAARALVVDDEKSDTWAHGIFKFDNVVGEFGNAEVTVLEEGPLRRAIGVRTAYKNSELTQIFYLTAGARELHVKCKLKLDEKHVIIKLAFPTRADEPVAAYSMPFGFITKECDGAEEPAQQWAGIYNRDSGGGLALINDSKYSFCADGSELRMTAARSAGYADHYGRRDGRMEYLDQGELEFQYALMPFAIGDPSCVVRAAALLNQPLHVTLETHHDGDLDNEWSGVEIGADNIICETIKQAEDGDGYVIRLYETAGAASRTRVAAKVAGFDAELDFTPHEIKTIRVSRGGAWRETLLTES